MRVSKTYKQSEWLVEGPEEMAALKADQAREVEDLKRRHEDEVENLKLKHERETERQSKKDEAEAERESQQEDTLPDIEDSKYLQDAVDEGKLVAGTLQVLDVITKKLKKEMEKRYKKDAKDGMAFINQIAKLVGMTASDKKQTKNKMFLKMDDVNGQIQEDKEEQDRDIKDREGTQPKKYYKGLDKKTKEKRDAHFKKGLTGPAPGDKDEDGKPVKTKKSIHTKKFAKMFGEKLGKNADAGDYIKDFRKSDAPQFKGKSDKKIQKMAIAAYLDKKDK